MSTRALTVAAVERLKPPKQGQADHFDRGYPGLALRISYGGSRSWIYFYRLHGKLKRLTLGHSPAMSLVEARTAWRDAHLAVARGESPTGKPAFADSVENVAAEWIKRDQANNRSVAEVRRVMERDVLPAWNGRLLSTISRRDVLDLIDGVADRGAVTMARRLHAHLHRFFRWAVGRGILETNPMANTDKPGVAVKRDRVLTDAELAAVHKATYRLGWPFGPAIRLLILTGARRDEIGSLRWSEIDGNKIKLSGARTKNGEPHVIPLSPSALEEISGLPRIGGSDYVFTSTGKTPISGWSKAKRLLETTAAEFNAGALADWRLHDLRRTTATGLQRLGVNLQVIEAVLGHVGGSRAGIVGVYQRHRFGSEKRVALEAWAREVERIANGEPTTILQ